MSIIAWTKVYSDQYIKLLHLINPFVPNAPFLYPRKHKKNLRFSDDFKGHRKGALRANGLKVFIQAQMMLTASTWRQRWGPIKMVSAGQKVKLLSSAHHSAKVIHHHHYHHYHHHYQKWNPSKKWNSVIYKKRYIFFEKIAISHKLVNSIKISGIHNWTINKQTFFKASAFYFK